MDKWHMLCASVCLICRVAGIGGFGKNGNMREIDFMFVCFMLGEVFICSSACECIIAIMRTGI